MKVVKEYLESSISYKSLSEKNKLSHQEIVKRWVNAYKSQGYEGLKVKIKKLEEKNYWLQLENDAIKKR
ncbi:MAG: hypothetical protein E7A85_06455 [Anaerococcus sp.]|nr:hypothetical protein [Anaerococcus sp.]